MKKRCKSILIIGLSLLSGTNLFAQAQKSFTKNFLHPPEDAKPWVYWYWMEGAVSEYGIKADLIAMKEDGIGGAYLMPVLGPSDSPLVHPPVTQLSPLWWTMIKYAMHEADSLSVKLAMHVCDGFATAGGPWITPALSMQKVVWSELNVQGGTHFSDTLPQPETHAGYYKDIAVFAFPSPVGESISTNSIVPKVTTSIRGGSIQFLADENNERDFVSHTPCWIQYTFKKPFTCRSIRIRIRGISFQARRLLIEVSNDGKIFHRVGRLTPPRSGWEDYVEQNATYAIKPVTARFFRFVYNPAGTEPGSEDLDVAKWKPSLKLCGIQLFSKAQINQFEGKNGEVWRISSRTTSVQVSDSLCVPLDKIINITSHLDAHGHLVWNVPPGKWTILRMGHTSTGQTNATGGGGKGLECDKFNPQAVKLQFDHWFGEVFQKVGDSLASRVLKIFHVDSWECGSQNWSPVFRKEFIELRGYDPLPYLPAMAGVPVQSANVSERFLYDVRLTIAQVLANNFFGTLAKLAHERGCQFSAESVAPTMESDGMLHYSKVDIPMGEFWLRSPTHDKPDDILDAVSGGHIYGKKIIQAESFTELHEGWDEYPGMLKTLLDRNYALGINRAVYHVFVENPWPDRKPGMTLNGVGTYFQRDLTWWREGHAWVQYAQRCQALLQQGHPVVDLAVYTGNEIPRRAVLPDRLVPFLPGIFGEKIVDREKRRLANVGEPMQEIPKGVKSSANIFNPAKWIDPLHGYKYDSFNEDTLLRLAKVHNGKIVLPGGASYGILIFPGARRMQPEGDIMLASVAKKLLQLVEAGATIMLCDSLEYSPGLYHYKEKDNEVQRISHILWDGNFKKVSINTGEFLVCHIGKGKVIKGPFHPLNFDAIGLTPDVIVKGDDGDYAKDIAWTHRVASDTDIYFISNQLDSARIIQLSLGVSGKVPELYDPVTNEEWKANDWRFIHGRTILPVHLQPNESLFILLQHRTNKVSDHKGRNWYKLKALKTLNGPWNVSFNPKFDGPENPVVFNTLKDWSKNNIPGIRYYSGSAVYTKTFTWKGAEDDQQRIWLDLGKVKDIAGVQLNGVDCGTAWTYPYRVEVTKAIWQGNNQLRITVTNTWANRLTGDHQLPKSKRITWTNAPYRLQGDSLLPSGLLGPIKVSVNRQ